MDCNVICIKRANIRAWDVASNEVRAHRQRFFYCELVASIYLSPLQSRSCDKARCLKIPHEGLCALYGFVLVCSDKVCLHTVSLAQGSFISWINDSFSGIFTTRLSDNRSLVKGALHSGDWLRTISKGNDTGNVGPRVRRARTSLCQPDPANEFCHTVPASRVAAWHWSLSGLRGQWGCEMPSVVVLGSPFLFAQMQQDRKKNHDERSVRGRLWAVDGY